MTDKNEFRPGTIEQELADQKEYTAHLREEIDRLHELLLAVDVDWAARGYPPTSGERQRIRDGLSPSNDPRIVRNDGTNFDLRDRLREPRW